jgi:hypothetical protein
VSLVHQFLIRPESQQCLSRLCYGTPKADAKARRSGA